MADTIVLYPSPGRGHLVSMVELGKLLLTYYPSFSIAVVISAAPFENTSTDQYIASVSAATSAITFHHLLPVALSNTYRSLADVPDLLYELGELNNPNLCQTLITISKSSNLKAFVIDFFCNASFQVSSSLNIPTYYYFTSGANGIAAFIYFGTLHKNITKSFGELGDTLIDFPGVPSVPAKDLPAAMLDRSTKTYERFLDTGEKMVKSAGLIVNTFELLEERAIKALLDGQCAPGKTMPPIYCIGPVIGGENRGDGKDKHECLHWLDSQPSRSVIFLCFGSMGKFSVKQLKEMAIGLEKSGVKFLWVVRAPLPDKDEKKTAEAEPSLESFLPEGFSDRTKDMGLVVKSWAPQVLVLNHGSVGGFVTHCGWNSVLEAVCAGVPMLAWPLYAEQKMNKRYIVEAMKVALPVAQPEDGFVSAAELEERVTELMTDSDKGRAVRDRVIAMKAAAAMAMQDGGSSRVALNRLAETFKGG